MQFIYTKIHEYSLHPHAFWILMLLTFLESFIFPIPPDFMMALMIISNRNQAFKLAFWATIASVGGAMVGYYIGYQLYQSIGLWIIQTYGYQEQALKFQEIGKNWGFWIIALKSLTPIPFKVVTILSGATSMDFMTFVWGSLIGRGARFFIFCGLTWHFGPQLDDFLKKRMGLVIFLMFAIIIFGFLLIKVIL